MEGVCLYMCWGGVVVKMFLFMCMGVVLISVDSNKCGRCFLSDVMGWV